MDVFPRACASIPAALLSQSWRCLLPAARTGVSSRLAAAVLCRAAGWEPMVGGTAVPLAVFSSAAVKVVALLTLPAAGTSVSSRLAATVLCRPAGWTPIVGVELV
jgi:hypothetical protein